MPTRTTAARKMSLSKNEKKAPKKPRPEDGPFPECMLLDPRPARSALTRSEEVVTEIMLSYQVPRERVVRTQQLKASRRY